MLAATIGLWLLAGMMAALAEWRRPDVHRTAMRAAVDQGRPLLLRLPLAILAATLMAPLLPEEAIARLLGAESGLTGILLASVLGGILPGGPMVTFPLIVVLFQQDSGLPQMIALMTAWSVLAVHRVLAFELPLMGGRFVLLRVAASVLLAPLAGVLAAAMVRGF